jgi:hypothetical protein
MQSFATGGLWVARIGRGVSWIVAAVVAALAFNLLVPRTNLAMQVAADVPETAKAVAHRLSFVPVVPRGLPPGWVPLSAEIRATERGTKTWHVGYWTPDGSYAGVEQAPLRVSPHWMYNVTLTAPYAGSTIINGRRFTLRNRPDRFLTSFVWRGAKTVIVITGKAKPAELAQLIAAIQFPISPPKELILSCARPSFELVGPVVLAPRVKTRRTVVTRSDARRFQTLNVQAGGGCSLVS